MVHCRILSYILFVFFFASLSYWSVFRFDAIVIASLSARDHSLCRSVPFYSFILSIRLCVIEGHTHSPCIAFKQYNVHMQSASQSIYRLAYSDHIAQSISIALNALHSHKCSFFAPPPPFHMPFSMWCFISHGCCSCCSGSFRLTQ